LKQNDFDYQGHLTIEKWLKVERNYINSKTSTTFSSKNTLGTRFFIAHKVSPAKLAKFFITKERDIWRQIMDHTALGKSFEINLCEKNNSSVHFARQQNFVLRTNSLRIAFTELGLRCKCKTWFRQKCRLLPDKDYFHFVYTKYDPGA